MSGRHVEDVLPRRGSQAAGEAHLGAAADTGVLLGCAMYATGCDHGGNGRHRADEYAAALARAAGTAIAAFRELHDDKASWWDRMRARSSSQAGAGTFGGAL